MSKISKSTKWFIISFICGILALTGMFFVEDFGNITGELNLKLMLLGTGTIFILIVTSLYSLLKANVKENKENKEKTFVRVIISLLIITIPLLALFMDGLIFIIYFFGK